MQPPVYSPVRFGSLLGAAGALVTGGAAASAEVRRHIAQEYGCDDALLLDSGTSALTLALKAAGAMIEARGRATVIALPAYGCFDLATAVAGTDLRVIPYDVMPRTLGPDWDSLSRALDAGASVVVMTHWYGVPVDAGRVLELAGRHGAMVIDDAAQGVGAAIGGRPLGTFGDFGVLSFGRGKGRTGGGGGALLPLTGDARSATGQLRLPTPRRRGMREYVALKAQWALGRPSLYWIPASLPFLDLGNTPYHEPGPVEAMPASCAGALAIGWQDGAAAAGERRAFARQWREANGEYVFPLSEARDALQGELRVPVVARSAEERQTLLATAPGAMPAYPATLVDLPAIRKQLSVSVDRSSFPGAMELVQRLVTTSGRASR